MKNEDSQKLQNDKSLCRQILGLSPKIRYVGLMNDFGRTISGQLRKDVVPLFSPDEARDENFLEATRNQFRKKFEKAIGKTRFTITSNENVIILTIPRAADFYYITLEKNVQYEEIQRIIDDIKIQPERSTN